MSESQANIHFCPTQTGWRHTLRLARPDHYWFPGDCVCLSNDHAHMIRLFSEWADWKLQGCAVRWAENSIFLESQAVAGLMHGLFICPMLIDRLLMNSAVLRQVLRRTSQLFLVFTSIPTVSLSSPSLSTASSTILSPKEHFHLLFMSISPFLYSSPPRRKSQIARERV